VTLEKKKAQAHVAYGLVALTISIPICPRSTLTQILRARAGGCSWSR
jgi:hypothetical protein